MNRTLANKLWAFQVVAVLLAGAAVKMTALAGPPGAAASNLPGGMVLIPEGVYKPLFRGELDPKEIRVAAFCLDACPVTNGEFLDFVRANPKWRRSQVKRLFADESYLKHWSGDLEFTSSLQDAPVTFVSWFAAKSYSQWKGRRLPTLAEWEYAAAASPSRIDGENDPAFQKEILRWYAEPAPTALSRAGAGRTNFFGVHDLHGLVWEWVSDFNTALVTGDARGDTGLDRQLFCGAGAQGAGDRGNYAAFMRSAFRSSLRAGYAVHNLGFRCAKDP
jgi:formylglycine-generating enzyme required for sulfatase activity